MSLFCLRRGFWGARQLYVTGYLVEGSLPASPLGYFLALLSSLPKGTQMTIDNVLAELRSQRDRIDQAIAASEGTSPRRGT